MTLVVVGAAQSNITNRGKRGQGALVGYSVSSEGWDTQVLNGYPPPNGGPKHKRLMPTFRGGHLLFRQNKGLVKRRTLKGQ